MHDTADLWLAYMTGMFWQSSVVALVALVAYVLLRRQSAALRYGVLCLVLVKLLLPTTLRLECSLGTVGPALLMWTSSPSAPHHFRSDLTAYTGKGVAAVSHALPAGNRASGGNVAALPTAAAVAVDGEDHGRPSVAVVAFAAWLTVVAALFLLHLMRFVRTGRRYRVASLRPDAGLQVIVNEARAAMRMKRRVQAYRLAGISTPVVAGLVKPRIIFPDEGSLRLSASEIRFLAHHELAHIRRFDLAVNAVQIIVQVCWFFHPAVWLVNHLIRTEREMACDDIAVVLGGTTRSRYAEVVLKTVRHDDGTASLSPALAGLFGHHGNVFPRIKRLIIGGYAAHPALRFRELGVLLAAAVLVFPLAQCRDDGPLAAFSRGPAKELLRTRWDGTYFWDRNNIEGNRITLVVDSVAENRFYGQMSWKFYGMTAVAGTLQGGDLLTIAKTAVIDSLDPGLIVNDTFAGRWEGDVIRGTWRHGDDPRSGCPFALVRNFQSGAWEADAEAAVVAYKKGVSMSKHRGNAR